MSLIWRNHRLIKDDINTNQPQLAFNDAAQKLVPTEIVGKIRKLKDLEYQCFAWKVFYIR